MAKDKIVHIIDGSGKNIKLKIGEEKTEEELINDFFEIIELINNRKSKADIDVTRINLEKAVKLAENIIFKRRMKKNILGGI